MNSILQDKLKAEFAPKTDCEWYPGDFKATATTAGSILHFNSEGQACYRYLADSERRHLDNRTVDETPKGAGLFLGVGRSTLPGQYLMDINTLDRAAVVFEKDVYQAALVGTINIEENSDFVMKGSFEGMATLNGVNYRFQSGEFLVSLK